jgi:hypothetical protein
MFLYARALHTPCCAVLQPRARRRRARRCTGQSRARQSHGLTQRGSLTTAEVARLCAWTRPQGHRISPSFRDAQFAHLYSANVRSTQATALCCGVILMFLICLRSVLVAAAKGAEEKQQKKIIGTSKLHSVRLCVCICAAAARRARAGVSPTHARSGGRAGGEAGFPSSPPLSLAWRRRRRRTASAHP